MRLFGSWRRLLEAAEMAPLTRPWTQDEIIEALRRHRAAHRRLPTAREWTRRGADHPPASTVVAELRIVERGDPGGDRAELTVRTLRVPW